MTTDPNKYDASAPSSPYANSQDAVKHLWESGDAANARFWKTIAQIWQMKYDNLQSEISHLERRVTILEKEYAGRENE